MNALDIRFNVTGKPEDEVHHDDYLPPDPE